MLEDPREDDSVAGVVTPRKIRDASRGRVPKMRTGEEVKLRTIEKGAPSMYSFRA